MEALGKDDFEEVAGAWLGAAGRLAQPGSAEKFFGCQVKVRPEMGCGTDAEDGMKRASFCQSPGKWCGKSTLQAIWSHFKHIWWKFFIHLNLSNLIINTFRYISIGPIFFWPNQNAKDPVKLAEEIEEVPSVWLFPVDREQLDLCQELHKAMPKKEVG